MTLRLFITIILLYLQSCSGSSKVIYEYQAEQTGKQYEYFHKSNTISESNELTSISYTVGKTNHYYEFDHSEHNEISLSYSMTDNRISTGLSAYYYFGKRHLENKIEEIDFYENLKYKGYGLRFDFSHNLGSEKIAFRPFSIQLGLDFEDGDYLKWRNDISKKINNLVVFGLSDLTFSFHYVPEISIQPKPDLSLGLHGGFSYYLNDLESRTSSLIGIHARYSTIGISLTHSRMTFDHVIFVHDDILFPDHTEKVLSKYQNRLTFSVFF